MGDFKKKKDFNLNNLLTKFTIMGLYSSSLNLEMNYTTFLYILINDSKINNIPIYTGLFKNLNNKLYTYLNYFGHFLYIYDTVTINVVHSEGPF